MQDEGKTVVDLGDEFIGFGCNQGERLKVCSIRPLPCVPNAGEGERAGLGQSDVEDALDGRGPFCFPRRVRRRTKEVSRDSELFRAVGGSTGFFLAISVRDSMPWLRVELQRRSLDHRS